MSIVIETVYRARIDFDVSGTNDDVEVIDQITSRALIFGRQLDECYTFAGNACCGAYLIGESANRKRLEDWVAKSVRYIKRRKGGSVSP